MAFGCGRSSISALRSGARVPGPSCWARRRPCWNQDAYCTVPPILRPSHASASGVDESASVCSGRGCPTLATAVSHPAEAATASAGAPILGGIPSGADDPPPPADPSAAAPPAPEARAGGPWTRLHNTVHYAVVGAGLAGVATAWQLLQRSPHGRPVVLDLYDAAGIAAGGSGAAAGLLHPYNPRGKLLWRGEEAMAAALELVTAAEAAPAAPPPAEAEAEESPASGSGRAEAAPAAPAVDGSRGQYHVRRSEQFVWPTGLVRPAANPKQAADFARSVAAAAAAAASAGGGGAAGGGTASATGAAASRSSGKDGGGGDGSGDGGGRGAGGGAAPSCLRVLSAAELQALVPGLMTQRSEGSAAVAGTAAAGGGGEDEAAAAAAAARTASAGGGEGSGGGPNRRARRAARAEAAADAAAATVSRAGGDVAGLLIPQGVVLDVGAYLRALWRACEVEAGARGDGSCVRLRLHRVTSLERLSWEEEAGEEAAEVPAAPAAARAEARQYDAIVVAAGAAAATIEEVEAARLPLQLCQGLTLVMQPPQAAAAAAQPTAQTQTQTPHQTLTLATPSQDHLASAADPQRSPLQPTAAAAPAAAAGYGYPAGSPSLLGQPYLAAQGRTRLVVGATKSYGWSPEAALAACGRSGYADAAAEVYGTRAAGDAGDVTAAGAGPEASEVMASASTKAAAQAEAEAEAVEALRSAGVGVWAPLADWRVTAVREGVRALPPRTTHGSLPLLGRLSPGRPWWLVAGLGSRGLVYHGWLGRLIADAVLYDSEGGIPAELTAWRDVAAGAAVFEAP